MKDETFLSYTRLKLHIDIPTVEETWLDGYECAKAQLLEDHNPFKNGTIEHFHWQEGWWAGYFNEEPLFNLAGENNPGFRLPMFFAKKNTLKKMSATLWEKIKACHLYIRLWHIITGIFGYFIIIELMDLFSYAE